MADLIIHKYKLQCSSCHYIWNTKTSQISAKCPSCGKRMHGTANYEILRRYTSYEKSSEDIRNTY